MLRLQLQGRCSLAGAAAKGSSCGAADPEARRGAGIAEPAAAAAAAAAAALCAGMGGASDTPCRRLASEGCCCCCCVRAGGSPQMEAPDPRGSRPPSMPLSVAAAASSASSAARAAAGGLALPLAPAAAFRLASTSAARGVVAGRPPGVGAGGLAAVAGPAAGPGARRCSKGVLGSWGATCEWGGFEGRGQERGDQVVSGCARRGHMVGPRGEPPPKGRGGRDHGCMLHVRGSWDASAAACRLTVGAAGSAWTAGAAT